MLFPYRKICTNTLICIKNILSRLKEKLEPRNIIVYCFHVLIQVHNCMYIICLMFVPAQMYEDF